MAGRIAGQGSSWCRRDLRWAIYLRDGCACVYCGARGEDVQLSLDHVLACDLGGENRPENLVTACVRCNSAKQARSVRDWYAVLRDRGVDTAPLAARIRRQLRRDISTYRATAKRLLADRASLHTSTEE